MTTEIDAKSPASNADEAGSESGAFDLWKFGHLFVLVAGGANVIMQLAMQPVARGVVESTVDTGALTKHPIKRARTSFTYIAVALFGTDEERLIYRTAVNSVHKHVHSGPDSPVTYNAFNPELQLWVAACMYRGLLDVAPIFGTPLDDKEAAWVHGTAARLATTLQVKPAMWPADIDAFWHYWNETVPTLEIDQESRDYLHEVATLKAWPLPIRLAFGRLNLIFTKGFLPQEFRELMHYSWTDSEQRIFDRALWVAVQLNRLAPRFVRRFPFNACLWDLRRRIRTGTPLV